MKKFRIDEITENLDNLRKPLNNIERSKISKHKLYPYYGANNIMDYVDQYIFDEEIICIAEDGGAWGFNEKCSYVVKEKCWVNNHAHVLRAKENLNIQYLSYYLNYSDLNSKITGTTRGKLTKSALNSIEVLLPSLEKQEVIVNVLDKAQELIDKRKAQIEALDELVKSQFIEMFGEPISNPKGWNREKMNDVAPVVNYKGDFNEEKIWLLNLDMVESNTGKIIDYNYVMKNEIGSSTCTFDTTNVLYSKLRPYLNKVVIPNSIGYATSEMVPLQPLNSKINRYYLTYMLRNKSFVDYISEKVAGAKMPRVSMNDFRNFEVPIPPIELQNQFVDFVKQVDKLKFEMQESLKELEDNFNSLMQRAFKGELFN